LFVLCIIWLFLEMTPIEATLPLKSNSTNLITVDFLISRRIEMNNIIYLYPVLGEVMEYMRKAHGEQERMNGTPYYLHPIAVTEILFSHGVRDIYALKAALCHDLLEDTSVTFDELRTMIGESAAAIVKILTKPPQPFNTEPWERNLSYYQTLRERGHGEAYFWARWVKAADRIHNLSEVQFAPTRKWQHRYLCDTMILMGCINNHLTLRAKERLEIAYWEAVERYVA
jgi:(p)ppGpp synthase/HD superfamily hydrolase